MADMIAMLDGLGAYGEKPIGDVDPRLLPSYTMPAGHSFESKKLVTYSPRPYTLGSGEALSEDGGIDRGGMSFTSKALIALGVGGLILWQTQSGKTPLQGYPEPEMVKLNASPRHKRKKKK